MCNEVCARLIREIQRGQRRRRKQQEKDLTNSRQGDINAYRVPEKEKAKKSQSEGDRRGLHRVSKIKADRAKDLRL